MATRDNPPGAHDAPPSALTQASAAEGQSALLASLPLLAAGASLLATQSRAAEPVPLDEEFLEYLAQLEGDEDDWTWFEADEVKSAPVKPPASKPASAEQPAQKTPPRKAQAEVKR
jgi:hypothetical protein